MKIKYYVTLQLYQKLWKNLELASPEVCDLHHQRFRDDEVGNHYYGLNCEKEVECKTFYEIASYDSVEDRYLVLMPSIVPFVSDIIERNETIQCKENPLTLTEFLNHFDFDYVVYQDDTIGLIDLQKANLGNIEDERFYNNRDGVFDIIERLGIYYEDYIFEPIQEMLQDEHNIDTSRMNWKELYKIIQALGLNYDMDILPYIFFKKELVLDSDTKKIVKE